MAMRVLIRTQNNAIPAAADSCFTKQNYSSSFPNTTLSVDTPVGVLGGSVAAVSAGVDYTVVPGTKTLRPVGLFLNDAAGAPFDNSPAVASGKVTVTKGQPSVEVDVYETRNAANSADLAYSVGDKLYCSDNGFLTNEVSTEQTVIGIVTKAPSVSDPTIGVDMRI